MASPGSSRRCPGLTPRRSGGSLSSSPCSPAQCIMCTLPGLATSCSSRRRLSRFLQKKKKGQAPLLMYTSFNRKCYLVKAAVMSWTMLTASHVGNAASAIDLGVIYSNRAIGTLPHSGEPRHCS